MKFGVFIVFSLLTDQRGATHITHAVHRLARPQRPRRSGGLPGICSQGPAAPHGYGGAHDSPL